MGFSQKAYLDSLWKVWSDVKQPDSCRLQAMYDFAWDGYLHPQPDSSYYYSKQMLSFAENCQNKKYICRALNLQFNYFLDKGDLIKAIDCI